MSEQPANYQDSVQHEWQLPPLTASSVSVGITEIHAVRKNICPECGESVDPRAERCGACDASLSHVPRQIRCMHCHTTASSELVVCPGCGRELREAPPKLMTVGAPAVLALLLVLVLATQWERISPVSWLRNNVARGVVLVEGIGARIEPEVVFVMTPIVSGNSPSVAYPQPANASNNSSMAVAMAPNAVASVEASGTESAVAGDSTVVSMAAQDLPIGIGGPQNLTGGEEPEGDNGEFAVVAEVAPAAEIVAEPMATETPLPTETPWPTATPEPPTATPTVEPTATEVAATPTATWTAMSADSNSNSTSAATTVATATPPAVATATPTTSSAGVVMGGMAQAAAAAVSENDLPTATPTVTPTLGPTPTPTPVVYQVRPGDTLVTIASTYAVTVDELMDVNDMSEQDVYVIQPGQMLFIPVATPVPSRLEAPLLAIPPDGATLGCSTGGALAWQRVQFIKDSDRYVLHLGFVSGRSDDGQETVTWVVAQSSPVTQTEWQLDTALCDLASDEYGRQWRWWVEVVESADSGTLPVSPPSEIRRFVWQ